MPVENKEISQEQQINEMKQRAEEREGFVSALKDSDILKNLDLTPGPFPDEETQPEELSEEQPKEEVEQAQETETEEQPVEEQEESEEDSEELIPKSKIQSRIDKLKGELEYWKNKAVSETKQTETKATDEITQKLENMSETELENLKDQARDAWMDAKIKGDVNLAQQYRDLEKKADKAISTAPQRFSNKQAAYYQQAVRDIASTGDFKDSDVPKILEIAREIYSSEPDLQKDIKGQGLALKAAAREYRSVSRLSLKAKETPKLKSQLNTLKKATALDSKGTKVTPNDNTVAAGLLRKSKNTGLTEREKISLMTNDARFNLDSLIPSDLRGR